MMGRTHIAIGAAAGAFSIPMAPDIWPLLIGAAVAGSILPDIDHPQSKLGRRCRPISDIINKVCGHRGGTHSLLFFAVLTIAAVFLHTPLGLAFGYGILSHLAADTISYSGKGKFLTTGRVGIPMAWPMTRKRVGIRIVYVNGWVENAFILPGAWLLALGIAQTVHV